MPRIRAGRPPKRTAVAGRPADDFTEHLVGYDRQNGQQWLGDLLRDTTTTYSCLMTGLYELRFFTNLCYNMNWLGNTLFMCLTCFLKIQAGRFRPAALKFSSKQFFENHFPAKDKK